MWPASLEMGFPQPGLQRTRPPYNVLCGCIATFTAQWSVRKLVNVPVTGVRYNSSLWMCTLNTLTWPDPTRARIHDAAEFATHRIPGVSASPPSSKMSISDRDQLDQASLTADSRRLLLHVKNTSYNTTVNSLWTQCTHYIAQFITEITVTIS